MTDEDYIPVVHEAARTALLRRGQEVRDIRAVESDTISGQTGNPSSRYRTILRVTVVCQTPGGAIRASFVVKKLKQLPSSARAAAGDFSLRHEFRFFEAISGRLRVIPKVYGGSWDAGFLVLEDVRE